MNASPWEERAAAYALDALDATERMEFEALLANSSDARRDVAEVARGRIAPGVRGAAQRAARSLRARVLADAERVRPIIADART